MGDLKEDNKRDYVDIVDMIEMGISNYENYYLPKSAFSSDEIQILRDRYFVEEVRLIPELAAEVEGIGDEGIPLSWSEEWHQWPYPAHPKW